MFCIHGTCVQNATLPCSETRPSTAGHSFSMPARSELLPDPTRPMTQVSEPWVISMSMPLRVGGMVSICKQTPARVGVSMLRVEQLRTRQC